MSKIISIHSFRGGTGKSNTTANVAALFAAQGMRAGEVTLTSNSIRCGYRRAGRRAVARPT